MFAEPARYRNFCFILVCVAAIAHFAQSSAGSDSPDRETTTISPPPELKKFYLSADSCKRCHNEEKPKVDEVLASLCRLTEMREWAERDKHRKAYEVLTGPRGRQMASILGWDVTAQDKGCVTCHGVRLGPNDTKDDLYKFEEGVSCVACHGPYRDWEREHKADNAVDRREWRKKTRTEKEEKYGMTDLWDPGNRAKMCLSCHVGNAEEGKVVTHEMYAAGHPPLPSVEVSAFSDFMRHWQYLYEKKSEVQKDLGYDPSRLEKVELVLVGAAASLRESMNMVAGEAKKSLGPDGTQKTLLDFAQFDCYACHHELRMPSWRQERGYVGKPGRPTARPWPTALIRLCVQHAYSDSAAAKAEMEKFNDAMTKLADAYSARPFGDPQAVAVAATALSAWSDALVKKLQAAKYSPDDSKKLLVQLCLMADSRSTDFDSARQIVWAFNSIYTSLYESGGAKHPRDSAIRQKLKQLDTELLMTSLPSGQDKEILASLRGTLRLIGDYNPAQFATNLGELAKLLN